MRILLVLIGIWVAGCSPLPGSDPDARITMLGDSVLAWNRPSNRSVGDVLATEYGAPVVNFSIVASRITQPNPVMQLTRMQIPNQFDDRRNDWIVVNGGANDLYFECLCLRCETTINQLTNVDGGGEIPDFLTRLRDTGAKVMYVGYHRTGGFGSAYDRCGDELNVVESRVRSFADATTGVYFADMRRVFPPRSKPHYDWDNIHPSPLGSATIAKRLAMLMQDIDNKE